MKKAAVIILAVFGVVLGTGLSASAAYPPGSTPSISVPANGVVAPGGSITATVSNVKPGATVTFNLDGKPYTATADASGKATVTITAPTAPGSYQLVAIVGAKPYIQPITVKADTGTGTTAPPVTTAPPTTPAPTTVPPSKTVPETGSNSPMTGAAIGVPLLVGGLALLFVSRRRRPVVS